MSFLYEIAKLGKKIKIDHKININYYKNTITKDKRRRNKRTIRKGRKNGIMQVAQNLINMKISSEQIKKATGLTDEELEKLKSKI